MAEIWPVALRTIVPVLPELVGFAADGGPPLGDHRGQVVTTDFGWWEFEGTYYFVRGSVQQRMWTALTARLKGRSGTILFPFEACLYRPSHAAVTYSDGATHSDGTPFSQDAVSVVTVGATALNANSINLRVTAGSISEGDFFSIGNRLYLIGTLTETALNRYTATISPWTRTSVASGAECNFANPVCEVGLVDPRQMRLEFSDTRTARATVKMKEI